MTRGKNKICQGPVSCFDGNMVVSAGMAHMILVVTTCDISDTPGYVYKQKSGGCSN